MARVSDIGEFLHPRVIDAAPEFAASFAGATPFRHVVIDDFLSESACAAVCEQFPCFDEGAAVNEDGQAGGKATQERVRALGPAFRSLDDLARSAAFRTLVGRITGIERLEYDPHYFGGGTHENRHGQDLDPHIDFNYHPLSGRHRRLNLILYLNEEWKDEWGGSLQLHRDPSLEPPADEIVTITPLRNRCVIFETTERSWHGFPRIDLPPDRRQLTRRSFALYLYTRTRPAAETAAEHSTVYVERHLPQRFAAGRTLSAQDVDELKSLLRRRDQHLSRLYRQNQELQEKSNQPWVQATMNALRRQVDAFENVTSLRVSAPLRAIKRAIVSRRGVGR